MFTVHTVWGPEFTQLGVFRGLGWRSLAGKLMHTGSWGVWGVYGVVRRVGCLKSFEGTSPDTDRPMEKITRKMDEQTLMGPGFWGSGVGLCMLIPLNLIYRRCPQNHA